MKNNIEYFLKFWGGAAKAIAAELGTDESNWWFKTPEEREALLARIKKFDDLGLVCVQEDGPMSHKRTVASVVFKYDGHTYVTQQDFGYEYPDDSVHYMYEDGNYSCDCNRSTFIQEIDPEFPHMDCGHTIELVNLKIAKKD